MKTAEEVAEEVWAVFQTSYWMIGGHAPKINMATYVAQALTAFAEERYQKGLEEGYTQAPKRDMSLARAEALEEAAKLMDNCHCAHEGVAKQIRALKAK